jgi:hypothetical protein
MPLTGDEISAFTALIGDVVRTELRSVREEVQEFRSEVNASFDSLFKRDETREQEYLTLKGQIEELEKGTAHT